MKLIAGLGNPGREYERTPHNVGFDVVEELRARLHGEWSVSREFSGKIAKVNSGSTALLLVQPTTFMNASGDCVGPVSRYYRVEAKDIVVVLDDAELPPGRLRVRAGGSNGGHNGLASIIQTLGTSNFPRVRIGVGRGEHPGQDLAKHVLGRMPAETRAVLDKVIPVAADAALRIVERSVDEAMNEYNAFNVETKDGVSTPNGAVCPA